MVELWSGCRWPASQRPGKNARVLAALGLGLRRGRPAIWVGSAYTRSASTVMASGLPVRSHYRRHGPRGWAGHAGARAGRSRGTCRTPCPGAEPAGPRKERARRRCRAPRRAAGAWGHRGGTSRCGLAAGHVLRPPARVLRPPAAGAARQHLARGLPESLPPPGPGREVPLPADAWRSAAQVAGQPGGQPDADGSCRRASAQRTGASGPPGRAAARAAAGPVWRPLAAATAAGRLRPSIACPADKPRDPAINAARLQVHEPRLADRDHAEISWRAARSRSAIPHTRSAVAVPPAGARVWRWPAAMTSSGMRPRRERCSAAAGRQDLR